jgi:hypothetical protein
MRGNGGGDGEMKGGKGSWVGVGGWWIGMIKERARQLSIQEHNFGAG